MRDESVLVTGATGGIGFWIAMGLARAGARTFVTGRDEARGRDAVDEIRRVSGNERVELLVSDGSSIRANVALAEEISRRVDRLDVLVNNVGGGGTGDRRETDEGLEVTLATHFVGRVALTTRLVPLVEESPKGWIVEIVSSAFQMWKREPLDDVESKDRYVGIEAYAHAKILSLLFVLGLARRIERVRVNAVNPGMAWTPATAALTRDAIPQWRFIWPVVRWFQRRARPEAAARGPLVLAGPSAPPVTGAYFDKERRERLPSRFEEPALQDRVAALGETLVARALGSNASVSGAGAR